MAAELSAGLLLWRRADAGPQFLLAHPGGPFWAKKDAGAWMIPKGIIEAGEEALAAALREFAEETGLTVDGPFEPLTPIRQKAGKEVHAFLVEADPDLSAFAPGPFEMEWPPRSGRRAVFPEIDRIAWFSPAEVLEKVLPSQAPLLAEALERIRSSW